MHSDRSSSIGRPAGVGLSVTSPVVADRLTFTPDGFYQLSAARAAVLRAGDYAAELEAWTAAVGPGSSGAPSFDRARTSRVPSQRGAS